MENMEKNGNLKVTKNAGVVGSLTLLSRIFGFLRDAAMAWFFGAGWVSDAFFVAFRIPNFLRKLFAEGALSLAFVPVFVEQLTSHLRSADFFEVETYPTSVFESTGITPHGDHWMVEGDLELHGVTGTVSFPASIEIEGEQLHAMAEFSLNRIDFGITYPGRPSDPIAIEIPVSFEVFAVAEGD